jgi:acyl-coenzyme A synthetase/AMP-(fatty) acid ligase
MPMRSKQLEKLLSGPDHPDLDFMPFTCTHGAVHAMAADIHRLLATEPGGRCCLCTQNRGILAAASLAALATDTELVLPYSFSPRALADILAVLPFERALTDRPETLPPGIRALVPSVSRTPRHPLPLKRAPDAPFLQIFTGGTTARPKFWSKSAANLFGEALYQARIWQVAEEDRLLSTAPPHHIYGFLFSVLLPLVAGAGVAFETPSFPEEIRQELSAFSPSILVAIPMHYRILNGGDIPATHLRLALSSAGRLDPEDGAYFYDHTGIPVTEIYGSTETGGVAARRRTRDAESLVPFEVLNWKILQGRLSVRSPFLSPELPLDADGYYLTADRVRQAELAGFTLLGRADGIVKIGGKRVDLEEVREKIRALPRVSDAVLIVLADNGGRESRICAMVQTGVDREELMQILREVLEPHATPRQIVIVDRIPLSPAGKYDRTAIERRFR